MSTIGQTLNQIQALQDEINESGAEDWFSRELMNFTTVVFFQFLPHSVLDEKKELVESSGKVAEKYYELASQPELLSEFIRFSNIGQFLCIWNAYEKYLRQKYRNHFDRNKFKIKELFDDLIAKAKPAGLEELEEEFEVMRNTRNSLHEGGVFNRNFKSWSGRFSGVTYSFLPGEPVTPLRVADVSRIMWKHYQALEASLP